MQHNLFDDPVLNQAPEAGAATKVRPLARRDHKRLELVESIALDAPTAEELAYLTRIFCQTSLPYRNPGEDVASWTRSNGGLVVEVRPKSVHHRDGYKITTTYQWPYGIIPRLFLIWLSSQVVDPGSNAIDHETRQVILGGSLAEFLRNIGISSPTGGTNGSITRVRKQVQAVADSVLSVNFLNVGEEYTTESTFTSAIASHSFFAWSSRDPDNMDGLFKSSIVISPDMYEMMKNHPVPLDTRALRLLRSSGSSGLALDIYTWLVHRLRPDGGIKRPYLITWEHLAVQFGSNYKLLRQFKAEFIKQLAAVQFAYPGARFEVQEKGLLLKPSAPAITPKPRRRKPLKAA